ncbi:MAG TPA: hypothetical protein VF762_05590, partial [Blastocatellia bacterium]
PDIQRLEQSLVRFRYQARPLGAAFERQLLPRRTSWWPRLAAAAAVLLMAVAGVWVFRSQPARPSPQTVAQGEGRAEQPSTASPQDGNKSDILAPAPIRRTAGRETVRAVALRRKPVEFKKPQPKGAAPEVFEPSLIGSEIAVVQPIVIPFVDVETSKHIERSQMLLRSFRNMDGAGGRDGSEIAYERQQSRGLLYQNIVLRRDAEAKGNLPVEDLLGSLEPFLIDIANLPEKPSGDDVSAIKERMRKKEILSSLQIYSAPTLSQVFK